MTVVSAVRRGGGRADLRERTGGVGTVDIPTDDGRRLVVAQARLTRRTSVEATRFSGSGRRSVGCDDHGVPTVLADELRLRRELCGFLRVERGAHRVGGGAGPMLSDSKKRPVVQGKSAGTPEELRVVMSSHGAADVEGVGAARCS